MRQPGACRYGPVTSCATSVPRRTAFGSASRSTSAYQPSAPGTEHDANTSETFTDVNLETRRPDRSGTAEGRTAAIGAVVHPLATAIEEGRDLSSMSGILADTAYRLLLA